MKNKTVSGNPLIPVCVIGLILALAVSWGMVFFGIFWGKETSGRSKIHENSFARELEEYDFFDAPKRALEGENPELTEKWLSRLQKQARGVEEALSVLKRRRELALTDRRFIGAYAKAAREAAEFFAYSAPIAAVAADAVLMDNAVLTDSAADLLRKYSPRFSQNRFDRLALSVHVLAGELDNPASAAAVPAFGNLVSLDFSGFPEQIRSGLLVDDFLLRAAGGDISGASVRMNALLAGANRELVRMGAEFFYDHNNPQKAAELFLSLAQAGNFAGVENRGNAPEESDAAMAAGALLLAGEIPGARNIWLALSRAGGSATGIRSRSLYNMAASSAGSGEELSWLEKIFSLSNGENFIGENFAGGIGIFSIIRYTRLLESSRSIAILETESIRQKPLLDLELLRRKLDTWPPTRSTAEVWMLLGRNSENEELFEWAAWYFDHQKLYDETGRLLKEAARNGMTGSWMDFHRSLALLEEGKTAEAEKILLALYSGQNPPDWRIPANLGRIQEGRRAVSAALKQYEEAAALAANQKPMEKADAARLQMRLSRCLEALGRTRESRRALEAALELDPENLDIRRELRRFDAR